MRRPRASGTGADRAPLPRAGPPPRWSRLPRLDAPATPARAGAKLAWECPRRAHAPVDRASGRHARQYSPEAVHIAQPVPQVVPSMDGEGRQIGPEAALVFGLPRHGPGCPCPLGLLLCLYFVRHPATTHSESLVGHRRGGPSRRRIHMAVAAFTGGGRPRGRVGRSCQKKLLGVIEFSDRLAVAAWGRCSSPRIPCSGASWR